MNAGDSHISTETLKGYNASRTLSGSARNPPFCYAPFTSLYFGRRGKISACGLNRSFILGNYPETSIRDAWEGYRNTKLRTHLSNNDLTHGCKDCELSLLSGNLDGILSKNFDSARMLQNDQSFPSMMEFELHNSCNLECIMCSGVLSSSIRKNRENRPPLANPYEGSEFITELREFIPHLSKAVFFGGEPFLVNVYYDIWETMKELNPGMQIWVTTNGTILSKRVKELLENTNFSITLSLESVNKSTYEKIRLNSNFEKVMNNLDYFIDYTRRKGTSLTLNMCAMPQNWKELPEVIRFVNKKSIPIHFIPVYNPKAFSLSCLSPKELQYIIAHLSDVEFPITDATSKQNASKYRDFIKLLMEWESVQVANKVV